MTIYSIKDGNYGAGSGSIVGGTDFIGTLEDAQAEAENSLPLEGKISKACSMIDNNYQEYCELGLSYTYLAVEYGIINNDKTRDEVDKKFQNVDKGIDTCFDWTMDEPRVKLSFVDKRATSDFLKPIQTRIAANEELLRDEKTTLKCYTQEEVKAWIASPTYPTYTRVV